MTARVFGALAGLLMLALPMAAAQAAMEVSEGWSRQTVPGVDVGVGYFTLKNTGTHRRELLKITSPLASDVELHQSSVDAQGVAHMWPVGKLELAPGEVVRFMPNGRHLMLLGLKGPLRVGTQVPVTLVFEDEEPVTVLLEVRPLVEQSGTNMDHMDHMEHMHH